ncbi:radical SAM protein with 4Fe4S-binding SPASM domain [Desulfobaculum xiamenense]|uniref:Radical SAM protein with 4Fe4S-binding SPASM domain n=1 Tax=Desulfobaculum xiamenense TaxID=995050 RepID=A0A846QS57_9BACT|nr:radical SAM protein [Desulfobaculum xiamenense]NJB69203.1 radical SAM protein with 4Fe4S-binding SPASM domain [Desulfobaculum xiamenense]
MAEESGRSNVDRIRDHSALDDVDATLGEILGERFVEYRRRWRMAERELVEFPFPLFLVMETVNTCNYRCIMCFRHSMPAPKPRVMPDDLFESVMAEAAAHGCPSLSVNWNNEPLMDPNLVRRVARARESGFVDVRLNTNASLLDGERSRGLVRAGLTRLSVSLDAATRETYEAVRVGGNWDRVMGNIEQFLRIRKELGARLPLLRVTFVRIRENAHEVDDFVRRWKGVADYVSIQSYVPHIPGERAMALHPDVRSHMADITCSQPFERLVVGVDGDVYPCCSPVGTEIHLGNVRETPLAEIWRGAMSRRLRTMMRERTWDGFDVCRRCLTGTFGAPGEGA